MRIKQLGDPILRTVSKPIEVEDIGSESIQTLLNKMKEILNGIKSISDENGNAISAPQAGQAVRMILLRINNQFVPMINPQITQHSEQTFEFEEECFSFYNLRAKVTRFVTVTVSYFDENGHAKSLEMQGEFAGLVQHEIDHLDGIFFLDRVTDSSGLESVDHLLKDQPERLKTVKQMMDYMAS